MSEFYIRDIYDNDCDNPPEVIQRKGNLGLITLGYTLGIGISYTMNQCAKRLRLRRIEIEEGV